MTVYRVSGEGLLRLVTLAAAAPGADVDTILGIVHGADLEDIEPASEAELPDVSDGPDVGVKPAKPE